MTCFRHWFLLIACGACIGPALLLSGGEVCAAEEKRPNILFIFSDDQSYRTVSCYPDAYREAHTPNIDRLAARGVRFSAGYIGAWCMASRATMLTGLHPYGIESMKMVGRYPGSTYDPGRCRFWPSEFRKNGYVTGQIGKWHTGDDTGYGRDWDFQKVWNHTKRAGGYYTNQLIETNGGSPERVDGYSTDNYTEWAEAFIQGDRPDPDKPWYLWLCYGAVHGPYTPAERHLDAHKGFVAEIPEDIFPPREGKPAYSRLREEWVPSPKAVPVRRDGRSSLHGDTLSDWLRQVQQTVLALDEGVGRLMAALEASGQLENTLVVFTSDQGYAWGQHGFIHKVAPYDANIRVPLIISQPGTIPEGVVCEAPVGGVDLVATFFDVANIAPSWFLHGRSVAPLLRDPNQEWHHPVLNVLTHRLYGTDTDDLKPTITTGGVPWWVSLRQGRYKYIRNLVDGEVEELYDLGNDPEELENLAYRDEHASLLKELRQSTVAELRRTQAGFVERLPPVSDLSK